MSCFRPVPAYVDRAGGKPVISYGGRRPDGRRAGELGDRLELPCGHCRGCLKDRARSWSLRVMHEAQLYDSNLFVTLDYAPEFLPSSRSLEYSDFQGFMKRVRRRLVGDRVAPDGRRAIRFFVSGEYGSLYGRPHWHAVLFNTRFGDEVRFVNGTYRSGLAQDLWGKGQVVIGTVTPQSAAYVAGYTLSKVYGDGSEDHYEDVVNVATGELSSRRPEFCVMSRKPGIGSWWFERFGSDLFPHDFAVMHGSRHKVPRFYFDRYREYAESQIVEGICEARRLRAAAVDPSENSDERRAVREAAVVAADCALMKRGF